MVLAVVLAAAATANAAPISDLMPLEEPAPSVVVTPKVDMLARAPSHADKVWRAIDVTMLAVSTAALAVDWMQTNHQASNDWHANPTCHAWEGNPILGRAPSSGMVATYFVSAIAINAITWALLPEKYRAVVPIGVVALEGQTIAGNIKREMPYCGM